MKHLNTILTLFLALLFTACTLNKDTELSQNIRFSEALALFGDDLLISNFGTEELNPLDTTENRGYIMRYDGDSLTNFIESNGKFSSPKGMVVVDSFLYVADVNRVNVVNLKTSPYEVSQIWLRGEDIFANHIVVVGDMLLLSVTNSNRVLALSLNEDGSPAADKFEDYFTVAAPNGMLYHEGRLFVASYNTSGTPSAENVIYMVDDFSNPEPKRFVERKGQYDGLAFHDGWLYFSDWVGALVGRVELTNPDNIEMLSPELEVPLAGPAQIAIKGNRLFVPDLPNSRVVILDI